MGELPPPGQRPPLNVQVTGVVERPCYRIEKLYYESLPQLYVTANLYIPSGLTAPAPGIVYACGHSRQQKTHYQAHPRHFAELGFVCLIIETIELGEVAGDHHGCIQRGDWHWYSRGYTPAAIEMLSGIRGLDLLEQRPEVDATRLGVTGISGGGATTWATAAADERVRVAAPICSTGTLGSHLTDGTIDTHCDCMWWINTASWDLADVGGLIAPRPLLIASAKADPLYRVEAIRTVHNQLQRLYEGLGVPENLRYVETPGPHAYHEQARAALFAWFIKHLQGKDATPAEVGDIDESRGKQESAATLRVYSNGGPQPNQALTIQDDFCPIAPAPQVENESDLKQQREEVIAALRQKTFAAFPAPVPLELKTTARLESDEAGDDLAFTPETGVRLLGSLTTATNSNHSKPTVIVVYRPGEEWHIEALTSSLDTSWAKLIVEARGPEARIIARRASWQAWFEKSGPTEKLDWHLRRAAAWTGRTLASMWVYDTLRTLEMARDLPQLNGSRLILAAQGEMAAVALYAALLDGQVDTLILQNPPATQNAPSQPDGHGPAIEMLNCLRVTDLPYVAGLLCPTNLIVVGDCPATYDWAAQLYARLGAADKFHRVHNLEEYFNHR